MRLPAHYAGCCMKTINEHLINTKLISFFWRLTNPKLRYWETQSPEKASSKVSRQHLPAASSRAGRGKLWSLQPLTRPLILLVKAPPSWPNHPPKGPTTLLSNTTISCIRSQHINLEGHKYSGLNNTHKITLSNQRALFGFQLKANSGWLPNPIYQCNK